MTANDVFYYDQPQPTYQPCPFCNGSPNGCCVCDHFGSLHKDHPLFGAEPITDQEPDKEGGE